MALVPIVQPFCIRLITTKKERMIRMEYTPERSRKPRESCSRLCDGDRGHWCRRRRALVGFLMFGNLLRECGVRSLSGAERAGGTSSACCWG